MKVVKAIRTVGAIESRKEYSYKVYQISVEYMLENGELWLHRISATKLKDLKAKIANIPCDISGMDYDPKTGFVTQSLYSNV